ncbi:MAG TPA: hypothetical protein VLT32_22205 [Candidatus Sulfomarinibacteraceae bacterium]|nr:hypothetical protein [Candidatus Sulfomarinibacteraceae bacterium]
MVASAFCVSGPRVTVAVHIPQLRGASRTGVSGVSFGPGLVPGCGASGAWLQQSAVQWHSPAQQQK